MLGKAKDTKNGKSPASIPTYTGEKTIIGEHISIEGRISGNEDLIIDGSVKGSIELENHHITVGIKGQIEGEVSANNVTVGGHMVGNIKAVGKVEITKEADFNGEIKARRISVEDGAYIKAVIELEREPEKKTAPAAKRGEQEPGEADKEPIPLLSEAEKRK
jgi:cytoskeletal protein CcmA (bactofilin family)